MPAMSSGPDRAPGRLEVEVVAAARAASTLPGSTTMMCSIVSDWRATSSMISTNCGCVKTTRASEFSIIGRICSTGLREVDRERRGAEVHGRGVDQVELGAAGQHQRDGVARAHAERVQAAGDPLDLFGVLAPRVLALGAERAQGGTLGMSGGGHLERGAQRVLGQRLLDRLGARRPTNLGHSTLSSVRLR